MSAAHSADGEIYDLGYVGQSDFMPRKELRPELGGAGKPKCDSIHGGPSFLFACSCLPKLEGLWGGRLTKLLPPGLLFLNCWHNNQHE